MKNILWIGGIYAASLLAQLLTALLFLFLPWDPLVEAVILSCLLLVGQGCAVLGEGRLEQADKTERLLGIVYWIRKVMSAIFAAAVFHCRCVPHSRSGAGAGCPGADCNLHMWRAAPLEGGKA